MAKLTTDQRDRLPDSAFVFPDERKYPIENENHARNALARGARFETPERFAKIRAAVRNRYPQIKVSM